MAWFKSMSASGLIRDDFSCPQGTYRLCAGKDLTTWIPAGLRAKVDSGVIISSGSLMAIILHRVDYDEIDQHPACIIFPDDSPPLSGGCLEHGDWPSRTRPAPPDFLRAIAASGIGYGQWFSGLPTD